MPHRTSRRRPSARPPELHEPLSRFDAARALLGSIGLEQSLAVQIGIEHIPELAEALRGHARATVPVIETNRAEGQSRAKSTAIKPSWTTSSDSSKRSSSEVRSGGEVGDGRQRHDKRRRSKGDHHGA